VIAWSFANRRDLLQLQCGLARGGAPVIEQLNANIRKCAAVRFFFWMHMYGAIIVPFFREWGRLSFTAILLIQAWFMIWVFLLEVPTGAVADRYGRRVSIALAGVTIAIASPLYASVPRVPVFLAGEFMFAAALTLMSGADEALVYDTLKAVGRESEATSTMSALESWKLAGIVVGATLGGFVADGLGLRAPLFLQGIPALISSAVAMTLAEAPGGQRVAGDRSPRHYLAVVSGGIGHLRGHPVLRSLTLDMVATGAVSWLIVWTFQPQLMRVGVPVAMFGVVQSAMALGQIALLSRQRRVQELVGGLVPLLRLTAVLPALGFLALAATTGPWLSVGGILFISSFGLARGPLFSGALNRHIPSEERATVLSAVSAARTITIAFVYPVAGMLMDFSLPWALAAFGVFGLATALLCAAPRSAIEWSPE
jgi:MFS family permease